jgi:type IV pilus assembly protein PilY1
MPSVWNSLGPDDPTGQTSAAVLSFLRGDQSNEGSGPYAFRVRSKVLGDIVDSDIIFAGGENFSYQSLCPENYTDASCSTMTVPSVYLSNTYNDFVTAKQSRNKMLYVGANDGMLHGFDADTMVEQFAYVPSSGLTDTIGPTDSRAALVLLTDPGYNGRHRFYVDGSPWVGDVCFKSPAVNCATSDWRTILIGVAGNVSSSGLGKRSAFALDVTNPSAFTASNVLWEKSSQSDPDLGYIAAQPVVGRLNDGNYYAIFGNGYLSANGCPVLYLVNIATGAIRRLSATADGNLGGNNSSASVAAVCAGLNGLGRPSLFDDPTISASQPRTADAIYVGDMLGQLWKFDVSSSNPANWDVRVVSGGTRKPLFTARNKCGGVQPITGLIEIGVAPSTLSGAMLYFGTGRFLSPDDRSNTDKQSIYGLLDRSSTSPLNSPGGATSGDTTCATAPGTDLSARGNLQEQTLSSFATATDTYGNSVLARNLSSTAINWADKKNSKTGWFIDLPSTGERMVTAPTLLAGRVLFPTLIPNSDVCAGGGVSTIIAADPNSGGKTVKNIFSVSAPVTYDSIQTVVGIVKNLIAVDSGTNVYLFAGGSSGNVQVVKTIAQQKTGGAVRGRTAWREVFQ